MPFALCLVPDDADHARKLLGLTVPLRLALSAQAAGAVAVVAKDEAVKRVLVDDRLRIPVVDDRPSGTFLITAPPNLVVHRGLFCAAIASRGERDWNLTEEPFPFSPPFGFEPILAADGASRARARKALLNALRKPQDGWTSTYLNRHISLFVTRFLVLTPFSPNQVSIAILAVGLAGAWLATHGTYQSLLAGAFLFHMQSVLDGCDGEMSRLTFRGSRLGEWLDTIGDDITNYGFLTAAAYGLHRATGNSMYVVVGAIVLGCGVLVSAIEYRYLISIGSGDLLKYPIGVGQSTSTEKSFFEQVTPLFKRDTFVFLTFVAAALGVLSIFLLFFAIGGIGILCTVINAELRMARERRDARCAAAMVPLPRQGSVTPREPRA